MGRACRKILAGPRFAPYSVTSEPPVMGATAGCTAVIVGVPANVNLVPRRARI